MSTFGRQRETIRMMRELAYQIKDAPLLPNEIEDRAKRIIVLADAAIVFEDDSAITQEQARERG